MRCDMCPLCPIAEDDVCGIAEDPKYGLEHKDGMMGCRHPYNWVKKKDEEYCEHLAEMADGMARMMEEERMQEEKMQDALKKLQARLTCDELSLEKYCNEEDCDNCEYNYAQGNMGERKDVLRMAIEAMEKQIPKKPVKNEKQGIRYTDSYECPTCHKGFTGTGIADYCYHCGQAIDWSEK